LGQTIVAVTKHNRNRPLAWQAARGVAQALCAISQVQEPPEDPAPILSPGGGVFLCPERDEGDKGHNDNGQRRAGGTGRRERKDCSAWTFQGFENCFGFLARHVIEKVVWEPPGQQ
jgi:hypothetical protein